MTEGDGTCRICGERPTMNFWVNVCSECIGSDHDEEDDDGDCDDDDDE